MTAASSTLSEPAAVQEALWSPRADDWAEIQEGQMRRVFEAGLDAAGVAAGTRYLDVGCGAGLAARLAADRGADVSGLDATDALLAHARRRVPGAPFTHGELEALPYPDGAFDVVTGFNSFQYARTPVAALREACRVTRGGGTVLALVWGPPETCEAAAYLAAVGSVMPPPPPGAPGPFALSSTDALESLLAEADLRSVTVSDVSGPWEYADDEIAMRGLISSGPVVKAIQHAGEEAVRAAIVAGIADRHRDGGGYRLENTWRFAMGTVER